jgi:hypothetical protein
MPDYRLIRNALKKSFPASNSRQIHVPNKPKPADILTFIHSPADAFGFSGTDYRLIRNIPSAFQERIIGLSGTARFQNPLHLHHILAIASPLTL